MKNAAKTSTKLLGAAPANLTQRGLDHIIARHWFTSGAKGAGKFAKGTTGASLKKMKHTASAQGVFRTNTTGRVGTIAEYNYGRVIGTTSPTPARNEIRRSQSFRVGYPPSSSPRLPRLYNIFSRS